MKIGVDKANNHNIYRAQNNFFRLFLTFWKTFYKQISIYGIENFFLFLSSKHRSLFYIYLVIKLWNFHLMLYTDTLYVCQDDRKEGTINEIG